MSEACYVTAWSCLDEAGLSRSGRRTTWPAERTAERPLQWSWFSAAPLERFGRLDRLSQYAVAAVELALQDRPLAAEEATGAAVCLGTVYGSAGADCEFLAGAGSPAGPSPMVFSYTLPSAAIGEIAIRHRLTGASLCLAGESVEVGVTLLGEAVRLIQQGEAKIVICIVADAAAELCRRSVLAAAEDGGDYACAFVVEAACPAGRAAAATVTVERGGAVGGGPAPASPLKMLVAALADGKAGRRLELPGLAGTGETLVIEM
jgi:hypothetical protein